MSFIGFDEDISIDINDLDPCWALLSTSCLCLFFFETLEQKLVFEGVEGRNMKKTRDIIVM